MSWWKPCLHLLGNVISVDNYIMNLHFAKASNVMKFSSWKATSTFRSSGTADNKIHARKTSKLRTPPPNFHTFTQMSSYCTRSTFAAFNIYFRDAHKNSRRYSRKVFVLLPDMNEIWNMLTDSDIDIHRFSCCMLHADGHKNENTDKRCESNRRILASLRCDTPNKRGDFESATAALQRAAV